MSGVSIRVYLKGLVLRGSLFPDDRIDSCGPDVMTIGGGGAPDRPPNEDLDGAEEGGGGR